MDLLWKCDPTTGACALHAAGDGARGLLLLLGLVAFWLGLATVRALR